MSFCGLTTTVLMIFIFTTQQDLFVPKECHFPLYTFKEMPFSSVSNHEHSLKSIINSKTQVPGLTELESRGREIT